jgi:hypothetical protein
MKIKKKCKYCRIEMDVMPDFWELERIIKNNGEYEKFSGYKNHILLKVHFCKMCLYTEMVLVDNRSE